MEDEDNLMGYLRFLPTKKTYKDFMKNKAKNWEDMKDKMLDYYLCIYDDVEANFDVPKEFEKENV